MELFSRIKFAEKQRTIQEYVPGKQVTLAHLIANPDKDMCVKLGLDEEKTNAIGILTITPGEAATIANDTMDLLLDDLISKAQNGKEFYNMLKDDTTINKIQSNVKNLSMDFLLEASKQYINYKLGNIFNS